MGCVKELSKNAYILLKAIGEECKKEEGNRNDIESNNLSMTHTDFIDAAQQLSDNGLLRNGKYDKIIDNNLNPTDKSNVLINSPKLTEIGEQAFKQLS